MYTYDYTFGQSSTKKNYVALVGYYKGFFHRNDSNRPPKPFTINLGIENRNGTTSNVL